MRIVLDTNIVISAVFFGGYPRRIIEAVADKKFTACATMEIIDEYEEIVQEMITRKQGSFSHAILSPLIKALNIVEIKSNVEICRDPDDDKFINCALDSKAVYIVSGDKDLLVLEKYGDIEIVTAKEFCDRYL